MSLLDTSPPRTLPDAGLVAAVRAGSDEAFEALYVRYFRRIRGFVAGRLADPGRAEDITQEVFLSALRRLRVTEAPIALEPWLFSIARNACIDEFRRHNRGSYEVELPDDLGELQDAARLPSPLEPPAEVDMRQRMADLRNALQALSAHQHELIVLRELEGFSYEEIARRLGMSRPRVESSLFRARRKLGQEYAELVSGRRCASVQALTAAGEPELQRLGVRERRVLGRHLAHCQPCRRAAVAAGVDKSWLRPRRSITERAAALLPIGWLRGRLFSRAAENAVPPDAMHDAARAVAVAVAGLAAAIGGAVTVPGPSNPASSRVPAVTALTAAAQVSAVRAAPPAASPTSAPSGPAPSTSRPATHASLAGPSSASSRTSTTQASTHRSRPASGPSSAPRSRPAALTPAQPAASTVTSTASGASGSVVEPLASTINSVGPAGQQAVSAALGAVKTTVGTGAGAAAKLNSGLGSLSRNGLSALKQTPLVQKLEAATQPAGH